MKKLKLTKAKLKHIRARRLKTIFLDDSETDIYPVKSNGFHGVSFNGVFTQEGKTQCYTYWKPNQSKNSGNHLHIARFKIGEVVQVDKDLYIKIIDASLEELDNTFIWKYTIEPRFSQSDTN